MSDKKILVSTQGNLSIKEERLKNFFIARLNPNNQLVAEKYGEEYGKDLLLEKLVKLLIKNEILAKQSFNDHAEQKAKNELKYLSQRLAHTKDTIIDLEYRMRAFHKKLKHIVEQLGTAKRRDIKVKKIYGSKYPGPVQKKRNENKYRGITSRFDLIRKNNKYMLTWVSREMTSVKRQHTIEMIYSVIPENTMIYVIIAVVFIYLRKTASPILTPIPVTADQNIKKLEKLSWLNNEINRIRTESEWKSEARSAGQVSATSYRCEYSDGTETLWVEFIALFDKRRKREKRSPTKIYNVLSEEIDLTLAKFYRHQKSLQRTSLDNFR
ncbi:hypothetical protein Glove_346g114 [Diversispora epigaea]|uniref:Uncharacterized protein n=1 Tax=Diversispora epigaea TaxID=1348612 RepID=A0A397HJ71_9GLOM|nr:hypothetical protein Glove_346g114 [Diversispora epigaea]